MFSVFKNNNLQNMKVVQIFCALNIKVIYFQISIRSTFNFKQLYTILAYFKARYILKYAI